jgi:succinate dehydrogenase/fumarate reductase cytochrome b subunit
MDVDNGIRTLVMNFNYAESRADAGVYYMYYFSRWLR